MDSSSAAAEWAGLSTQILEAVGTLMSAGISRMEVVNSFVKTIPVALIAPAERATLYEQMIPQSVNPCVTLLVKIMVCVFPPTPVIAHQATQDWAAPPFALLLVPMGAAA